MIRLPPELWEDNLMWCTRSELSRGASNVNRLLFNLADPFMHKEKSHQIPLLKFSRLEMKLLIFSEKIIRWLPVPVPTVRMPENIVGFTSLKIE